MEILLGKWSLLTHPEAGQRACSWNAHMSRNEMKSELVLCGILLLFWENEMHLHT